MPKPMSAEEFARGLYVEARFPLVDGEAIRIKDISAKLLARDALIRQAAREEGRQWISVKDRLPVKENDGEYVLAWFNYGKCSSSVIVFHAFLPAFEGDGYTHWMPLPSPPAHIPATGQMVGTTTGAPCPCTDCRQDAVCGDDFTPCEAKS